MTTGDTEKIKAALEALVGTVQQWCHIIPDDTGERWLDSGAISSNAAAMRVLANHGLLTIRNQIGRRIIANWTEAARNFGADVDFTVFRRAQARKKKGRVRLRK